MTTVTWLLFLLQGLLRLVTGLLSYFLFFFFCLVRSLRDLSSQLGTEPRPPVVEVQRFNHWTSKEVPVLFPFD